MGFWGSGLYANDSTCDIRDIYIDLLRKQLTDEEAYEELLKFFGEMLGTDEEPLFWYALAETQWKTGRLTPEIKGKALEWIEKKGFLDMWQHSENGGKGWENTLEKLKEKLESPQPARKNLQPRYNYVTNPWETGDIYAYEINTQCPDYADFLGKYIAIQKIGDMDFHDDEGNDFPISIVQFFDKFFDEIPSLDEVLTQRILPFGTAPYKMNNLHLDIYEAKWEEMELCYGICIFKRNHYPKKYLTYIGNSKTNKFYLEKEADHIKSNAYSNDYIFWRPDNYFCAMTKEWEDFDYCLNDDGSFTVTRRKGS